MPEVLVRIPFGLAEVQQRQASFLLSTRHPSFNSSSFFPLVVGLPSLSVFDLSSFWSPFTSRMSPTFSFPLSEELGLSSFAVAARREGLQQEFQAGKTPG